MDYVQREQFDERAADDRLKEEILQSLCADLEKDDYTGEEPLGTKTAVSPGEAPVTEAASTAYPAGKPDESCLTDGEVGCDLPYSPQVEDLAGVTVQVGATVPPGKPPEGGTPPPTDPAGDRENPEKLSISPRKLAANRANAQHSTGPKTPEGKEKSRFNAVKYGLTSRYFPTLVQKEHSWWEAYNDLRMRLFMHFEPEGPIEEMLADKIVVETIRFSRLLATEQHPTSLKNGGYWDVLRLGTRYQSAINRQLFEAMKELERLQEKRKAQKGEEKQAGESCD